MVRKYQCLEVDSSSYWKPVKGAEERGGVGTFRKVEDQTSRCILDELQRSDGTCR